MRSVCALTQIIMMMLYFLQNLEDGMKITFQITISDNRRLTTYFAFCYPYSYSECQRRLARLDDHHRTSALTFDPKAHEKIYYYRFVCCVIIVPCLLHPLLRTQGTAV